MPSMGKVSFRHENKAGQVMEFAAACSVDSEGIFAIVIPDELVPAACSLKFNVTQPRTNSRIEHGNLETAKSQVAAAIAEYMAVEEVVERVIRFGRDLRVSFWQREDGSIAPNGSGQPDGRWTDVGNRLAFHNEQHGGYGVGLVAWIADRVTLRRTNSEKIDYRRVDLGNHSAKEGCEWGYRLNGFCRMGVPKGVELEEMPYTEEAAKFFHDALIAMCLMARQIDDFFKSPDALRIAIEKQTPLLAAPREAE